MLQRGLWIAAVLLSYSSAGAADKELNVGDAAPKLQVKEFVKGEPVKQFDKDKIYVVEFWATWCPPCRATIPHLTELQKKHKDVKFVGVSVYERKPEEVKPFVKEMGEKMDYVVAIDDVPAGAEANQGKMAKNWMDAAQQEGIPTAFIVNGDGKVAWIGHPTELEKPLDQVIAGNWDLKVAAADFKKEREKKRLVVAAREAIAKSSGTGDIKSATAALEKAIAADPEAEAELGTQLFSVLLAKAPNDEQTEKYGRHLVDSLLKDEPQGLNNMAWTIVGEDDAKPNSKLIKLAIEAAQKADELTKKKHAAIANTLAKAYAANGDFSKAVELQERAVEQAKGTDLEKDEGLKKRLEEYRKAAKK